MIGRIRFFSIVLLVCFAGFYFGGAAAQEGESAVADDDVNRVASQLFCPTCESVPVDVCPTEVCTDWRNEIRLQLAQGKSDQEILDYFAIRYGNGVLANPPARGFGLLIRLVPLVVLLAGGIWFATYLQSLRQTVEGNSAEPASPMSHGSATDTYRQQIEDEIGR